MNPETQKHWPYKILIIAALLIGFFPAIITVYPFHDDLFFWRFPFFHRHFPLICLVTLYVGRIIGAVILWSFFFVVKTVADLNTIRLFTGLVIAFCALGAYRVLYQYLKRPIDAALTSIIIFSLPAFEIWTAHAVQSYEVYAVIFVMMALHAVEDMPLAGSIRLRIASRQGLLAIVFLIAADLIYPSSATFYWAVSLILILIQIEKGTQGLRKKIENIYIPAISSMILFGCIYKFRGFFINFTYNNAYKPDQLVSNVPDKLLWFIQTVIPQTLNFWNIFPDQILPVSSILFIAGAVIITLYKEIIKNGMKGLVLKMIGIIILVISLIILSYLPNLICALNFNPYRCGAGLTTVFVILLVWALKTYCQLIPRQFGSAIMTLALTIAATWGVYRSYDNIDRFRAKPSALEYSFLKSSMNHFHGHLQEIHVVPEEFTDLYSYYDEFGVSAVSFDWYSRLVDMVSAMFIDLEAQDGKKWIYVQRFASSEELKYGRASPRANNSTYKYIFQDARTTAARPVYTTFTVKIVLAPKSQGQVPDSTLLIDMNDLYGPLKQIMGSHYNFKIDNKGSWSGEE